MSANNPFDFANPVTDPGLFAGRARELGELKYYIELAETRKGIGLAIVGARTSGKSSLLNMASAEAIARSFLVARVDLSRSDVESEQTFLQCLYESLMQGAKKKRLWGENTDAVYNAFRLAMTAGDAREFTTFLNLAFPQTYAMATTANRGVTNFPVALIVDDLATLHRSALGAKCTGIAILIDEADHLAALPSVLEKLRHLMSVASQLFVIAAGTENMLGSMDAVFAPIVRQFKRIRLSPFVSPSETRECLLSRLERVGQAGILSRPAYADLHSLAQGHPYEAQLIAHHMYRRYMENQATGFSITVSVLHDVLAEVERFRQQDHDRFATTVRKYSTDQLQDLSSLVLYPKLSLYEQASLDAAFWHPGRVKQRVRERRQELKEMAERFVNDKLIVYDSQSKAYDVNGDQFDKLYLKYLAKSKRIDWTPDTRPLVDISEAFVASHLASKAGGRMYPFLVFERTAFETTERESDPTESLTFSETRFSEVMGEIERHLRSWPFRMGTRKWGAGIAARESFDTTILSPTILTDLGTVAALRLPEERMPTAKATLRSKAGERARTLWLQPVKHTISVDEWQATVEETFQDYGPGMDLLGWTVELEFVDVEEVVSLVEVLEFCKARTWRNVIEEILEWVSFETVDRYAAGDGKTAELLAAVGAAWAEGIQRFEHLNNLGYLRLAARDSSTALAHFAPILESGGTVSDLPRYNAAIAHAMNGDLPMATKLMEELKKTLETERVGSAKMRILLVAVSGAVARTIEFQEQRDLTLDQAVASSLATITAVSSIGDHEARGEQS